MLLCCLPQLVKSPGVILALTARKLSDPNLSLLLIPDLLLRQKEQIINTTIIKHFTLEVLVFTCTIKLSLYSPWRQNNIAIITLSHIHPPPPPLKLCHHYKVAAVASSLFSKLIPFKKDCPCTEEQSSEKRNKMRTVHTIEVIDKIDTKYKKVIQPLPACKKEKMYVHGFSRSVHIQLLVWHP